MLSPSIAKFKRPEYMRMHLRVLKISQGGGGGGNADLRHFTPYVHFATTLFPPVTILSSSSSFEKGNTE